MSELSTLEEAVELLQELGLKEYEARCFVALSQRSAATAREISELSEVPRTRVYDAVRVLESKGLVEIQHSNPQKFRAVSLEEATATLKAEYEARVDRFEETIRNLPQDSPEVEDSSQEVWSLEGEQAISNRITEMVRDAEEEIVLIVGRSETVTDALLDALRQATDRDVSVLVGTIDESLRERVQERVPAAQVFVSGLDWLAKPDPEEHADEVEIGRLLLVDRSSILATTVHVTEGTPTSTERAVVGYGFGNGFIVIARRLLATGLLPIDDPGDAER